MFQDIAELILAATIRSIPNITSYRFFQFSVPTVSDEATVSIIDRLSQGRFRRLAAFSQSQYTHAIPDIRTEYVFAITSFGLTYI